jgi:hypothetical protein
MVIAPLSPLIIVIIAKLVFFLAKTAGLQKRDGKYLVSRSWWFELIGAGTSLLWLIDWMIKYEKNTGFSAGNAPLFWIFFYGPVSAAAGQLLALIVWWVKEPEPRQMSS